MTLRRAVVTAALACALSLTGCSTPDLPTTPLAGRPLNASGAAPVTSGATGATGGGSGCRYQPSTDSGVKDVGVPPATLKAAKATMSITTNLGAIEIALDGVGAPCATGSFAFLAGKQFFDNTKCHRLTTQGIWVLQCGDPAGDGTGGPAYRYDNENTGAPYLRGTVAIANTGQPTSNGSQFFINYKDNTQLQPNYTMLGQVTKGMEIVDQVAAGGVASDVNANGTGDGPPKTEIVLQKVTVAYL
ncbi:peptidylprolyl isomerase [Dactylosporangium sp. NPDC051541]|uniref:peptidylprolyl isomerase n=1 Tax=Dactylosporangium sp. NPDC051541 TaxID=3363977 RepID=UPI003787C5D8